MDFQRYFQGHLDCDGHSVQYSMHTLHPYSQLARWPWWFWPELQKSGL